MSLQGDVYRLKQEKAILTGELQSTLAVLALANGDIFKLVARGRLADPDVVVTSGIAAAVTDSAGRVDVEALERRIAQLVSGPVGGSS